MIDLLRDPPSKPSAVAAVTFAAALLVAVVHLWRSDALLTILAGTELDVLAKNLPVA